MPPSADPKIVNVSPTLYPLPFSFIARVRFPLLRVTSALAPTPSPELLLIENVVVARFSVPKEPAPVRAPIGVMAGKLSLSMMRIENVVLASLSSLKTISSPSELSKIKRALSVERCAVTPVAPDV